MRLSRQHWLGLYLRGVAMGAADLVPGVSGGTIALITGIYDRFIAAIASVGIDALRMVFSGKIKSAWAHVDGNFLLAVGGGILSSVAVLASLLNWLILNYPLPLWSLFCGLILASAIHLFHESRLDWTARDYALWLVGIGVALIVGLMQATQLPVSQVSIFLAGTIAISAMLLPGISGSFLLLILGMYQPVITALVNLDVIILGVFALGCISGLLVFSRVLKVLLARAQRATMAILYGFLLGSVIMLWPWQRPIAVVVDRHGENRVVQSEPVLPQTYMESVGEPMLLLCLFAFALGLGVVALLLSRGSAEH
jgi:putative membrane protein